MLAASPCAATVAGAWSSATATSHRSSSHEISADPQPAGNGRDRAQRTRIGSGVDPVQPLVVPMREHHDAIPHRPGPAAVFVHLGADVPGGAAGSGVGEEVGSVPARAPVHQLGATALLRPGPLSGRGGSQNRESPRPDVNSSGSGGGRSRAAKWQASRNPDRAGWVDGTADDRHRGGSGHPAVGVGPPRRRDVPVGRADGRGHRRRPARRVRVGDGRRARHPRPGGVAAHPTRRAAALGSAGGDGRAGRDRPPLPRAPRRRPGRPRPRGRRGARRRPVRRAGADDGRHVRPRRHHVPPRPHHRVQVGHRGVGAAGSAGSPAVLGHPPPTTSPASPTSTRSGACT